MKRLLPLIFCAFSLNIFGQITITNSTFPELGDTLRTATDNFPENIDLLEAGADKAWDFTSLSSATSNETIYLDPSEGTADVANANLLTMGIAGESYFQTTDTELRLLAGKGQDPAGFGIEALVPFIPPLIERRAPMNFADVNMAESDAGLAFGSDIIPDTLLQNFPLVPDSFRIRINQVNTDIVDAYGTLAIPGGTFNVLREKQTITRSTRIDALVPIFGWQDVTDVIIGIVGGDLGLGEITNQNFRFFSDESKEIIAEVTTDETGDNILNVTYKFLDILNSTLPVPVAATTIVTFPNPTSNEVTFEFKDLQTGNYTLSIHNLLGITLLQKDVYINRIQTEKIDVSNLQNGTYLYSLENAEGKRLMTKKLMIQK